MERSGHHFGKDVPGVDQLSRRRALEMGGAMNVCRSTNDEIHRERKPMLSKRNAINLSKTLGVRQPYQSLENCGENMKRQGTCNPSRPFNAHGSPGYSRVHMNGFLSRHP